MEQEPLHCFSRLDIFELCRFIARSFFVSGVIDRIIYVAGGNSTDHFEFDSTEVMDHVKGIWYPIASMGTNIDSYDPTVLNEKLLVAEGWLWPFYVSIPRVKFMTLEQITGRVAVYGHFFVVLDLERMKLNAYDADANFWKQ